MSEEDEEKHVSRGSSPVISSAAKSSPPSPRAIHGKSSTDVQIYQVIGSFFLFFNSWGMANTFGAFQTYYSQDLLSNETDSTISWIGSVQTAMLIIVGGAVTGPIMDSGHMMTLIVVGGFFLIFGMFMTSLATEFWQIFLAQGVCMGLGAGCCLLPSVGIITQHFTTRRSLANGIAASGGAIGGIIYPIVFYRLQPAIGFPWATRVLAFIMLVSYIVPVLLIKPRTYPADRRPLWDWTAFRNQTYNLYNVGQFFGFMGLYIPFFYVQTYAIQYSDSINPKVAYYLLAIINTGSAVGRIAPPFFADRMGPLNVMIPCFAVCVLLGFTWVAIIDTAGIVIFSLLYGFFSGTFVSLTAPAIASLTPEMHLMGTRMGMGYAIGGLGLLVGNPVSGRLLTLEGRWLGVQLWCGIINAVAVAFLLAARVVKAGVGLKHKV